MVVSESQAGVLGMTEAMAAAVLAAVILCSLAAGIVIVAVQRRHRRRIDALLGRLADFESRFGDEPAQPAAEPVAEQVLNRPPVEEEKVLELVGNDPLAGRTSHVRRVVDGGGEPRESLGDQAIACVHDHLDESFTAGMMAEELYVSIRTLERGIAASLDCTPSQLITAMKMREARRLLCNGRYRVNEVAVQLAFSSPQYFSRRFKSFYGISPSRFVREHGGPE